MFRKGEGNQKHTNLSINLFLAVFSQNVINQLQNGTVVEQENCHFRLFFDSCCYVKAAASLILIFQTLFSVTTGWWRWHIQYLHVWNTGIILLCTDGRELSREWPYPFFSLVYFPQPIHSFATHFTWTISFSLLYFTQDPCWQLSWQLLASFWINKSIKYLVI